MGKGDERNEQGASMLKRPRRSSGHGDGRTGKHRRQHLYIVLDDWIWGYSIRKVNLFDYDSKDSAEATHPFSGESAKQRLPPAICRLEAQHGYLGYFTAAGSKIVALLPKIQGLYTHPAAPCRSFPLFDVRSRGLQMGPLPNVDVYEPIFLSVGDGLFVLSSNSFQVFLPPPEQPHFGQSGVGTWHTLQEHPFKRTSVVSYAVHPNGRTIFVSTQRGTTFTTFTFDTEEGHWEEHGRWGLPFTGRAHFDSQLDAWVGLSGDADTYGYLCACDVASVGSDCGDVQCPTWKLSKKKLFSEDKGHGRATLVYMGAIESRFCLVQCISAGDDTGACLYGLTTFSLKFDRQGALKICNRSARCYNVPRVSTGFAMYDPVAFWL